MTGDTPACPVCLVAGARFYAAGEDRLFRRAAGHYLLYQCRSCLCVFQHPFPDREAIAGFYPENYWRSAEPPFGKRTGRWLKQMERRYREFVAADHVRFLQRCARSRGVKEQRVLDIGCGSGLFLDLARRRGFICHGMDASAQAVRLVREQYGLDVRQGAVGEDIWGGLRFDFVTLFHVLEHLTDPRAAVTYAAAHLKPGGSLILQVPNLGSLQARCFGRRWYGLDVPRHIINFTPAGFRLLLKATGFQIQRAALFSLRDNPASIASSLAPGLDPISRAGRTAQSGALPSVLKDFVYFGLVLACAPMALLEGILGRGGTIWVQARPVDAQTMRGREWRQDEKQT